VAAVACEPEGGASSCPEGISPCALVITEVFASPDGADEGAEFVEIYNNSGQAIDLRGLRLFFEYVIGDNPQQRRHTIVSDEPVLLEAGRYAALSNGGFVEGDVWDYGDKLTDISGSGVRVRLMCDDGTEIDSVCFGKPCEGGNSGDTFEFPENASMALVGSPTGGGASGVCETDVDAAGRWAVAEPTRNEVNPAKSLLACCPQVPDGATVVAPSAGDLVVTEAFANPSGNDGGAEWLEFHVELPVETWVDLDGLRFTTYTDEAKSGHVFSVYEGCTLVRGGSYVVMAGSEATTDTDNDRCYLVGTAAVAQWMDGLTLKNSDAAVAIWSADNVRLGLFEYGDAFEGQSAQWDEARGAWCASTQSYWDDETRFGTPGESNTACESE